MDLNYFKDNILPNLNKINSFTEKGKFLANYLPRISSGSGRIVYEINDKYVLKFAKNTKGISQNEVEAGIGTDSYFDNIVTQVIAEDDDYKWIVSEKAKKVTEKRIVELTGIPSLYEYYIYLNNNYVDNKPYLKRRGFGQYHQDYEIINILNENEFTQSIQELILNYDLLPGDLGRASTYGEVIHDGQPTIVLVDYGLNDDVYSRHYVSKNRVYEIFNVQNGNFDDLNDGDTSYIRNGMWALIPQGVGDGDNVVNEDVLKSIENRNYYSDKTSKRITEMIENYYECYDNVKEYVKKASNKKLFYENLLKLQEFLSKNNLIYKPKLGDLVTEINITNENGKKIIKFNKNLNERVLSGMKGSSSVLVKDKCKLGGETCNQGDINNLDIKPLHEEIDASEAYNDDDSLDTIINGKRDIGLISVKTQDVIDKINDNGLHYIPIKQLHHNEGTSIVYNDQGLLNAQLLNLFMNSKGGYANDETPEETYYVGKLLQYSDNSIQAHIDDLNEKGFYNAIDYDNFIKKGRKSPYIGENILNNSNKSGIFVDRNINEISDMKLSDLPFRNEIEKAGGKIYSVGGVVRDRFLNKESKDLDIIITGVSLDEIETILSKYGSVNNVGKSFGIIKFRINGEGEDIDIAIPRKDKPTGEGGHKGFEITSDHTLPIEDDLYRRDFTINSMASDVNDNIIDPYNGRNDIKNKVIRVVNPDAFGEDPLRMLRAVNFASRFGFKIEPNTMKLIQDNSPKIKEIPSERILTEFDKIVHKGNARIGAQVLKDTGLFREIFGFELNQSVIDNSPFNEVRSVGEFIFLMTRLLQNPSQFYLNKFSTEGAKRDKIYKEIKALSTVYDYYNADKKGVQYIRLVVHNMYLINPETINSQILPEEFENVIQQFKSNEYPLTYSNLEVDGNDLILMGLKGQMIGEMLKKIILNIYSDKLSNNKNEIINFIKNNTISEGVADRYAEKEFGIPDEFSVFNSDEKIKDVNEKPIGIMVDARGYKVPVYKNPKNLNKFDKEVRAISDINGDLYVSLYDKDLIHDKIAAKIGVPPGDIYYWDWMPADELRYLTLVRVGDTNRFGLSVSMDNVIYKGTTDVKNRLEYLLKIVKQKNPQFEFTKSLVYKLSEGVADKFFDNIVGTDYTHDETKYDNLTEKPIVKIYNNEGKLESPIYLNPKKIDDFDEYVRAVGSYTGDLYVASHNGDFDHGDIVSELYMQHIINDNDIYSKNNYLKKYVIFYRIGNTNNFQLTGYYGDLDRDEIERMAGVIANKIREKNPQFSYLTRSQKELNEGVADKYAEREFGIPDRGDVIDKKYTELLKGEPVVMIRGYRVNLGDIVSGVYQNPKNLDSFDGGVRAISDVNGDLYVLHDGINANHQQIANALYSKGVFSDSNVYFNGGDNNEVKYITLLRVDKTDKFIVSNSMYDRYNDNQLKQLEILFNRVKQKNPQYTFIDNKGDTDIIYENEKNKSDNNRVEYSAVVLDDESRNELIISLKPLIPDNWKVIAHHMTINLGSLNSDFVEDINKEVKITAYEYAIDDKVMAVKVKGYPTLNKIPHVTIAVNIENNGKPWMSNKLTEWIKLDDEIQLTGVVTEVLKNNKLSESFKPTKNNQFTGCLMAFADINNWDVVTSMININDVYNEPGYGIEDEPHVTVLYGLNNNITSEEVFELIKKNKNLSPIKLSTNKISIFENEDFDVVKFDIDSDRMIELNKLLINKLSYKSDYPDYHPHMTIAYVKKGCGKKYVKDFEKKYAFYSKYLVYSTDDGENGDNSSLKLNKENINENESTSVKTIVNSINKSKKIPKELKNEIIKLVNSNSEYIMGGFIKELTKPKELIDKCDEINGVSLGADKNGFYVYTHRARSKSSKSPEMIPIKAIKFIETTG